MAGGDDDDLGAFRTAWWQRLVREPATYELTRFAVLRLLALVYLVAFLALAYQLDPLLGSHGLLPVPSFMHLARANLGAAAYWRIPSLLWLFGSSDGVMHVLCWAGIALSAAALCGVTNALLQAALWLLYMSFVHVGQVFYGYGWEIQLLETGFLAVWLCPVTSLRPFPRMPAPVIVVWLFRWLIFRIMLGAALIKLRGDPCWRDLSCLDYHFETQPNPNPLSWSMHHWPHAVHAAQVLFSHFVELVVPWFAFGFRRWRHAAGALLVLFQLSLIASGNLSFLNWLTIVPALACFDDTAFARLIPRARREALLARFAALAPTTVQRRVPQVLGVVVAILSVGPVANLLSSEQQMNTSFDPLDLVNTYGAFGSVDRQRFEVILEGTRDEVPDDSAHWEQYELPCMPGDVRRRPCVITPYHLRLDWQMWFVGNDAARGEPIEDEPWLVHLVWQLLSGDPAPRSLFAHDPFPAAPPRWIRAGIWEYQFTRTRSDGAWWTRKRVGEYLPPVSLEHAGLREYVRRSGWR
ncbi:MAG TPA: lipase maturation factor family protein [Polyangiaceae bacterium]